MESVDISFHGYGSDTRELPEIMEVREFVSKLDQKFPFWLYFLSKHHYGLQNLLFCMLPPCPIIDGRSSVNPQHIGDLLSERWFPAMDHVSELVGLSKQEIVELAGRVARYCMNGRLELDS